MEKWTEHHHRIASALDVLLDSAERALTRRIVKVWGRLNKALEPAH